MQLPCHLRALACLMILLLLTAANIAQEYGREIAAENLPRLRSSARIDFADIDAQLEIGWFAANEDATEFLLLGSAGEIYRIALLPGSRRWHSRQVRGAGSFALIDAIQLQGQPIILRQSDGKYLINENRLAHDMVPVALFHGVAENEVFVEAIAGDGQTQFLRYRLEPETGEISLRDVIPFPAAVHNSPVIRIGRIDFPVVILSALAENKLYLRIYPDFFNASAAKNYQLLNGPAVFGAVNAPSASHFAWTNPSREQLNLLDLKTGDNRIVASLDGAYPQYLLLSKDASALLAVNLDFQPVLVAWDAKSGERYDLGPYRECGRIPDNVEISRDGRALIIGCDTGLEVWRIFEADI